MPDRAYFLVDELAELTAPSLATPSDEGVPRYFSLPPSQFDWLSA
jgi:hypothetical protein